MSAPSHHPIEPSHRSHMHMNRQRQQQPGAFKPSMPPSGRNNRSGRPHTGGAWALLASSSPLLLPAAARQQRRGRRRRLLLVLLLSISLVALVVLGARRLLLAGGPAEAPAAPTTSTTSLLLAPPPASNPHPPPPRRAAPPPPPPPSDFVPFANLTPLPAFTSGGRTSYVLGATLTRDARLGGKKTPEEEEDEEALLVDIFFMGVSSMVGGKTFSGVEKDKTASAEWRAAVGTLTRNVRDRAAGDGWAYACRFQLAHAWGGEGEDVVIVPAIVVPTATTVDGNVNDMVNILRCPLPEGVTSFCRRHQRGELQVALSERAPEPQEAEAEAGLGIGGRPLLNFTVPIATRSTGFLQPHTTTTTTTSSSGSSSGGLDPWSHLWDAPSPTAAAPLSPQRNHSVGLCVAGLRSAFASPLAELTVEFVEHHLGQGVGTIVLGADYEVGSKDWRRMELVLGQYVAEGRVVLSSMTAVGGREVHRELKKVYHYNQCLYFMKGLAEWVGVWDVDEFLTPRRGPPHTLLSVLDQYAAPEHNGGRAVGFLLFTSYSHALPLAEAAALDTDAAVRLPLNDTDTEIQWAGRRFARTREDGHDDMYQKSLLSARYIYFTGFHLPGACTARMDPERDWGRQVRDDDPEFEHYAKRVAKEEAAVFHFRVVLKPITYVRSKVWEPSEYALHYFGSVLQRIQARGLEALLVQFKTLYRPCPDELARLGAE